MGSDVNTRSVIDLFSLRLRPFARDQAALRAAGQDPLLVDLNTLKNKKTGVNAKVGKGCSRHYISISITSTDLPFIDTHN